MSAYVIPVGYQSKLEYETSWLYEAGIYHRFMEGFDNRFVVYFTDISDYLAIDRADPVHNGNTRSGWNIDTIQRWGVEYELNAKIGDLTVFGNYTYSENTVKENDARKLTSFWVDLPAKHKANLSFRYSLTDSVMITWDQRYVGQRKSEAGLTISEYTTSDLGAQISFFENKASFTVYISNLFGENYELVHGYPMPRQVVGTTLKWTFF